MIITDTKQPTFDPGISTSLDLLASESDTLLLPGEEGTTLTVTTQMIMIL